MGLLLLVALAGCSSVGGNPSEGCDYGGSLHPVGSTFPATDGCNSCSCAPNGQVACTLAFCFADGGAPVCSYGGKSYAAGASFPSTDGCNSCGCGADGLVACTKRVCVDGVDGGASCFYGGQPYVAGASFPSTDGCNSCGCSATGEVSCTERGCDGLCTLDATYTFGPNGGLVAYVDVATLTPPGVYRYTRAPAGSGLVAPAVSSCAPALPACRTDGAIDVADIMADLSDGDVQQSLAATTPPLYGTDARPVDGQVFEVKRSTGGSFLVGYDCPPTSSSCRPIPAGVAKLVADLRALNEQQLADPSCAGLRR